MKAIYHGIRNAINLYDIIIDLGVGLLYTLVSMKLSVPEYKWLYVIDGIDIGTNGQFEYMSLGLWLAFMFTPFLVIGKVRDINFSRPYFYFLRLGGIKNLSVYSITICITKVAVYCAIVESVVFLFSTISFTHCVITYLVISIHLCLIVVSYFLLSISLFSSMNTIFLLMIIESITLSIGLKNANLLGVMPGTWGMYQVFMKYDLRIESILLREFCLIAMFFSALHMYLDNNHERLEVLK